MIRAVRPLAVVALLFLVGVSHANIHLTVTDDDRKAILLGTFSFSDAGVFQLEVSGFSVDSTRGNQRGERGRGGFVLDPVISVPYARVVKNFATQSDTCMIDDPHLTPDDTSLHHVFPLNGLTTTADKGIAKTFRIEVNKAGLYGLFFYSCEGPYATPKVSFTANAKMYNLDAAGNRSYSGVGEEHLYKVIAVIAIVFLALCGVW